MPVGFAEQIDFLLEVTSHLLLGDLKHPFTRLLDISRPST